MEPTSYPRKSSLGAVTAVSGQGPEHPPEETSVGRPHDAGITKISADETFGRAETRHDRRVATGEHQLAPRHPRSAHLLCRVSLILSMRTWGRRSRIAPRLAPRRTAWDAPHAIIPIYAPTFVRQGSDHARCTKISRPCRRHHARAGLASLCWPSRKGHDGAARRRRQGPKAGRNARSELTDYVRRALKPAERRVMLVGVMATEVAGGPSATVSSTAFAVCI